MEFGSISVLMIAKMLVRCEKLFQRLVKKGQYSPNLLPEGGDGIFWVG
jgi:hypothetical protein